MVKYKVGVTFKARNNRVDRDHHRFCLLFIEVFVSNCCLNQVKVLLCHILSEMFF